MSSESPQKTSPKGPVVKSELMMTGHLKVTMMVAVITLLSIGLMGGGGYLLDQSTDKQPFFTIAGVLISFPLSQIVIFRWVKGRYVPSVVKKSQDSQQ